MTDESEPRTDGGETIRESDVFMGDEGRAYYQSVYRPVNYGTLEDAPATAEYPDADDGGYKLSDLPKAPRLRYLLGPSAIMLGVSLGSGETLFWPLLIAQNGWALFWAFWVGVLTQFFINTEIQRWTMATGESIFRAFRRLHGVWPWVMVLGGLFQLGWPGWASGAGQFGAAIVGLDPATSWPMIAIGLMILIWLSYQAHPIMYLVIEKAQTTLMIFAVIFTLLLLFLVPGTLGQMANVPFGAVQFGTLPVDMDIAVFLGGLAYAGAGGYANLSQSLWAREKGFGMSVYQGRVENPLLAKGDPEEVHPDGFSFEPSSVNLRRWKAWWKVTQQEHFVTFVIGLMIITVVLMGVTSTYAAGTELGAIDMWLQEVIPAQSGILATALLLVLFLALFSTQYAILEVFTRNTVDVIYESIGRERGWSLPRTFWAVITIFTLWGIAIIASDFAQPWILLVIGAAVAGVMMWPYIALTLILNTTRLPEHAQPSWARVVIMWWAVGFFGYFSQLLIGSQLAGPVGLPIFQTTADVVSSAPGGYVLWIIFLIVQIYTMYRSATGKMNASGTVEGAEEAHGFLA